MDEAANAIYLSMEATLTSKFEPVTIKKGVEVSSTPLVH